MTDKIFEGLKLHKEGYQSIDTIGRVFPLIFRNSLNFLQFRINNTYSTSVFFEAHSQLMFCNNMGNAIVNHEYGNLDDILLQLFKSGMVFIAGYGMKTITFTEKDASIFQNKCNTFKGKHWNDIIGDFIDACTELFKTGTVA